jgi:hypothetical protein
VNIHGSYKLVIVDTGSSISLVQPGIFSSEVKETRLSPFRVTGDTLAVEGEQDAEFSLDSQYFSHRFYVCALPTEAYGILGSDFLVKCDGHLDLEKRELRLKQPSLSRRTHKPSDQLAFTIFVKPLNSGGSDESEQKREIVKHGRSVGDRPIPH